MAFVTEAQARATASIRGEQFAVNELRKSAASDLTATFDVFLSHSFLDAEVIVGVKGLVEAEGLRVYVD